MEVFILKENLCKNCKKKIPKKNVFCDNFCQGEFYYKEYISKWKNGIVSGTSGKQYKDISNHYKVRVIGSSPIVTTKKKLG